MNAYQEHIAHAKKGDFIMIVWCLYDENRDFGMEGGYGTYFRGGKPECLL